MMAVQRAKRNQKTGRKKGVGQKEVYRFYIMLKKVGEDKNAMKTQCKKKRKGIRNSIKKQVSARKYHLHCIVPIHLIIKRIVSFASL